MDAQNEISLEINQSLLNKTVEVMVEGPENKQILMFILVILVQIKLYFGIIKMNKSAI